MIVAKGDETMCFPTRYALLNARRHSIAAAAGPGVSPFAPGTVSRDAPPVRDAHLHFRKVAAASSGGVRFPRMLSQEVTVTTALNSHPLGSFAHALHEAIMIGMRKASMLLQARRNRRAIMSLAHCDEGMLKDIGLTRSEVVGTLSVGFGEDPSALLRRSSPSWAVRSVPRSPWIVPPASVGEAASCRNRPTSDVVNHG